MLRTYLVDGETTGTTIKVAALALALALGVQVAS